MGLAYSYANLDRKEYFGIWRLGGGMKAPSLGRNLEARALGLLLQLPAPADTSVIARGAWAGCRIAATDDSDTPANTIGLQAEDGISIHDHLRQHFRDITGGVMRMMIADAPDALLDAAEQRDDVRLALGDLAEIYRCEDAAELLKSRFGPNWRKAYATARQSRRDVIPAP